MKYGFGVDLGGTTVKIAYFDEQGTMLAKWEIPTVTADGGKQILPDIAASIRQFIEQKTIDPADILGVGIGVPGPVNGKGVVNKCINLGWGVFNIAEELSRLVGFPVKAGNDANVAALGEYWKGGGKGCDNMVFVTLGTGVGGGIVVDGHLLHGAHGAGGEIGHMTLNFEETECCGCGRKGCAEQYCSATGAARLARQRLERDDAPSVLRELEKPECADVFNAAKAGDAVALEIVEQYFDYMGKFLVNLCCIVDPEVIVLGGGVCGAGQMLLDGVQRHYVARSFHACRDVKFAIAQLGSEAGVYGAFKLVLDDCG